MSNTNTRKKSCVRGTQPPPPTIMNSSTTAVVTNITSPFTSGLNMMMNTTPGMLMKKQLSSNSISSLVPRSSSSTTSQQLSQWNPWSSSGSNNSNNLSGSGTDTNNNDDPYTFDTMYDSMMNHNTNQQQNNNHNKNDSDPFLSSPIVYGFERRSYNDPTSTTAQSPAVPSYYDNYLYREDEDTNSHISSLPPPTTTELSASSSSRTSRPPLVNISNATTTTNGGGGGGSIRLLPSASDTAMAAAANTQDCHHQTSDSIRHHRDDDTENDSNHYLTNGTTTKSCDNHNSRYSIRLASSETHTDPSGSIYTAYNLHISHPQQQQQPNYHHPQHIAPQQHQSNKTHVVQHRYSEFAKLNQQLYTTEGITLNAPFPPRFHWAGRIGNWTPSRTSRWGNKGRKGLIRRRERMLDVWLMELGDLLDEGEEGEGGRRIRGKVRRWVLRFLGSSSTVVPPCDRVGYGSSSWDEQGSYSSSEDEDDAPNNDDYGDDNKDNKEGYNKMPLQMQRTDVDADDDTNDTYNEHYDHGCKQLETKKTMHNNTEPLLSRHLSNPLSFTLGTSIRQATSTLLHLCRSNSTTSHTTTTSTKQNHHHYRSADCNPDQNHYPTLPPEILHRAKGLCFLTVVKGGFLFSLRGGTGLILGRREDGTWTPPSAVGTVGVGWGALVGGDITKYLIVLNTVEAVKAFVDGSGIGGGRSKEEGGGGGGGGKTVTLGAELGVAVGPLGRSAGGNLSKRKEGGIVPAYAYAISKGLFMGMSFEGSIVASRPDVNAKFYGKSIDAQELLLGHTQPNPIAAQPLYDALNEVIN